jgi:hypothetical protein
MLTESELVEASVTVPRSRLPELYRYVAQLNDPRSAATDTDSEGSQSWSLGDREVADAFYKMVSPKARAILDVLIELPIGGQINGFDLAKAAGLAGGAYGVAGSLSSVGKAANKLRRELPYLAAPGETGESSTYRMTRLVADLFAAAQAASRDEVA